MASVRVLLFWPLGHLAQLARCFGWRQNIREALGFLSLCRESTAKRNRAIAAFARMASTLDAELHYPCG